MRRLVAAFAVSLVSLVVASAASAVTYQFATPIAGDSVPVTLEASDVAGGNAVDVTVSIPAGQGDLLGLFGNVVSSSVVPTMSATSTGVVTQWQFQANQVWKVGAGNVLTPVKNWDWGLRFGTNGSAGGAVTSATFRLHGTGLSVAQLTGAANQGWIFGVRIQSTLGAEGSAKVGLAEGTPPVGSPPTIAIASPANGALLGASPVAVSGTVTAGATVSVNGVVATVAGTTWSASLPLADGAHTITATATNAGGSDSASVGVTVDTTPPVVVIATPPDGFSTALASLGAEGTAVDATSPIASFTVNGQAVPLTAGAFATNVSLAVGANTLTATAVDAAGNVGSASVTVTRGEAPTIDIAAPPAGLLTSQGLVLVTGALTGTAPVSVTVNGVPATISGLAYSAAVPLVEGANTLTATATNALGNASASVAVTRDSTPPLVTITSPADGHQTADGSVLIAGTVVDASPIASFSLNGQPIALLAGAFSATVALGAGPNPVVASATDAAGNTGTDAISVVRGGAPTIAILSPASGLLTNQTPITVTGVVTGAPTPVVTVNGVAAAVSDGAFTASVPLVEGPNTLTATAANAFGSASDAVFVVLDTIPPLVVITSPGDGATTTASTALVQGVVVDANPITSFTLNASSEQLNQNAFAGSVALPSDGDVLSESPILVSNGATLVRAAATDAAGNVGSDEIVVIRGHPPTLRLLAPAEGLLTAASEVAASGTVTWTNAVRVNGAETRVIAQPQTPVPWSVAQVPLNEGRNVVRAEASNEFGTAVAEAVVTRDSTPPVVTILVPADGSRTSEETTAVSGTVFDASEIASFAINGSAVPLVDGSFATTLALVPGTNAITATATDIVGNTGSDSVGVFRGGPPSVAIASPAAGALLGASPTLVTGVAPGAAAVAVNGVGAVVAPDGAYRAQVPLLEGENTLEAVASNEFGSATASVVVVLDTTPPVVTILSPADGARTASEETAVVGRVEDASPIVVFTLNGTPTPIGPNGAFSATLPLALGANPVRAEATDAVGLTGAAEIGVVRGQAPTVAILEPAHGSVRARLALIARGAFANADTVVIEGIAATLGAGDWEAPIEFAGDGFHTLTAIATNEFGSATASVQIEVRGAAGALSIDITHPPDGSRTGLSEVLVTGFVSNNNAVVQVNGVLASVAEDNTFSALVPLVLGPNTVTATAVLDAETASDAVAVTRDRNREFAAGQELRRVSHHPPFSRQLAHFKVQVRPG